MISVINLMLDITLLGLLIYRIHKDWLFGNGAWLRISLCLAFGWLIVADFDVISPMINLPIITPYRGPGFRWIVLGGVLIDLIRMKRHGANTIEAIIADDKKHNGDKYAEGAL